MISKLVRYNVLCVRVWLFYSVLYLLIGRHSSARLNTHHDTGGDWGRVKEGACSSNIEISCSTSQRRALNKLLELVFLF